MPRQRLVCAWLRYPNIARAWALRCRSASVCIAPSDTMRFRHAAWLLAGLLAAAPALAAQRVIIITDSLTAHAERLNVQKGAQWLGQIARWRFGDYAVVSSK